MARVLQCLCACVTYRVPERGGAACLCGCFSPPPPVVQEKARYTFRVEWFDQVASLKRQYLLFYIVRLDGVDEIEIVRMA